MELTENKRQMLMKALAPLVTIWEAYLSNDLDDGARRTWGVDDKNINDTPLRDIELYQGRGGKQLLTLEDCREAAATNAMLKSQGVITDGTGSLL